ncbi:hypothetical protein PRNP1_013128 [Phytophthora ramorum]
MNLLLEPSAPSFLFEPDTLDEQLISSDILDLLEVVDLEGSCLFGKSPQHEKAPAVPEATLRKLNPRCCSDEDQEPKPKRVRKTSAARPRLRNKEKIELLRCEIKSLESELDHLRDARRDAEENGQSGAMWKIIAMRQSQDRERAQAENKALKELLTTQSTLTSSLSSVFTQWETLAVPDLSKNI